MRADQNRTRYEQPVTEVLDLNTQGILCLSTDQMEDPEKTNGDVEW